jgi:hypothetical protein
MNVTLVPQQNVLSASELVSVGVGKARTVLVIPVDVAWHPLAFVTITSTICPLVSVLVVYVADTPLCTLVPFTLKLKLVPPPPVNVTLVPEQNVLSASELVSVGVGNKLTVFVIPDDVAVQP